MASITERPRTSRLSVLMSSRASNILMMVIAGLLIVSCRAQNLGERGKNYIDKDENYWINQGFLRRTQATNRELEATVTAVNDTDTNSTIPSLDLIYSARALGDEITHLPGLNQNLSFRQFSGYLNISPTKNIFYWYVESTRSHMIDPLVFWTNGGPGCSSMEGFMSENGPFRPTKDGVALQLNPYSWNSVANMLYVEQPVTVGFSYTDSEKDLVFGDDQAANDNYLVIQKFLERFPHLRSHDFYLSGESYAGRYLPTLAKFIIEKNAQLEPKINLRGFLVGNPSTDPVDQIIGQIDTLRKFQVIPADMYEIWTAECASSRNLNHMSSARCTKLLQDIFENTKGLDPYALTSPPCKALLDKAGKAAKYYYLYRDYVVDNSSSITNPEPEETSLDTAESDIDRVVTGPPPLPYVPCQPAYTAAYLNREDVKRAIHAQSAVQWLDCSQIVLDRYDRENWQAYMEPVYKYLVDDYKKLRILVFSGDRDSICSTRGAELWLESLKWQIRQDWRVWEVDGVLAGYVRSYTNGVTFMTVHGAGHAVPAFKPQAALKLFSSFLSSDKTDGGGPSP